MPDPDKIRERMGGGGSDGDSDKDGGSSSSSRSKKSGSSKGGSADAFSLTEDQKTSPDDVEIDDASENLASGAELNYDVATDSLSKYKKRQVQEVRELHEEMKEVAKEHSHDISYFTLVFHAMMMNFAQNRVGIAQTIQTNFGKSEREATKIAGQICRKAGEKEVFSEVADILTKEMMDL